ncbi:ABC transporter permease [Corynebacterium suedekumii]|nr:ABC transporter permease [Corynebacterium suedekumii]
MLFLLISVTFVAFVLVEASPLDPVAQYVASMQRGVSADQVERITALWGLDRPWYERYVSWLGGMLAGDFGVSNLYRADVAGIIGHAIANSLLLMSIAWVLSGVLGYLLGVVSGATRGTLLDRAIVAACYVLTSTPPYVVGLVLMLVFAVQLGWVPLGPRSRWAWSPRTSPSSTGCATAVLPAITVAIVAIANVTLHTRQSVSQVMESDMARFARTRGLGTWGIVRHHGLRNTLLPAVMLQFTSLSMLFGGSALAEVVFSYHGLGALITKAAIASDVPLLLGAVTLSAVLVFVGNLIADVIAILVDPRVRRSVDA